MSQAESTFPIFGQTLHEKDRKTLKPVQRCNESGVTEPMTKADEAKFNEALNQLVLSNAITNKTLAQLVENPTKKSAPWWLPPILTICGVVVAVFGVQFTSVGSAQLRETVRLHEYQLEERKARETELSGRMFSLEFIFARVRQDLAAMGYQIDPQTGAVTQISKRRN